MSNRWTTLPEAADYLKISKDLLYKLAGANKVPAYKIGRIWRFNKIELDSWVKQNGHAQPIAETLALFNKQAITRANISKIKTQDGQEITKICGDIPSDLLINDGDRFLFISYDQSIFTHSLHKFPAKFFPELPRWIIRKYTSENDWVLDPFCGSATANLEALLISRNSVGIDIDPFAKFLARVKTTPLPISPLEVASLHLKGRIKEYNKHIPNKKEFPNFPYRDNWFNKYILEELTFLKREIISLKDNVLKDNEEANKIINFFLICFSSIIRAVSNADNNCTRTVIRKRLNKKVNKGEALERFLTAIEVNVPKMIEFSEICPRNIIADIPDGNDARDIKYPDGSFHLALTSPPYVNAVDYPRTHQLEIYWLGIENGSLTPLKKKHVGTESVSNGEYKTLRKMGIPIIDNILEQVFRKDPRRSYIVYKFLVDMEKNLKEVKRVLKQGGRYVIVIGNNQIRGINIESWKYIMEIASRIGFQIENYFGSEIIRHFIKIPRRERILTDWIIVLRKES